MFEAGGAEARMITAAERDTFDFSLDQVNELVGVAGSSKNASSRITYTPCTQYVHKISLVRPHYKEIKQDPPFAFHKWP